MTFRTRLATATVLVPDCLRTTSWTAFSPFRRASVRGWLRTMARRRTMPQPFDVDTSLAGLAGATKAIVFQLLSTSKCLKMFHTSN